MMLNYFKNLASRIYIFFYKPAKPRQKRRQKETPAFGEFATIKTVLDSLDELFSDMKLLCPKKSEFQKLIVRYGPFICSLENATPAGFGVLPSPEEVNSSGLGAGYEAYGLPSFLINYRDKRWGLDTDDTPMGEFFIAKKQTAFPFLRPKNIAACYECCAVGMLDKKPTEVYFNIIVDNTGQVISFPYLAQIPRKIKGRTVSSRMGLYYPDLESLSNRCNIDHRKEHLARLFCANYNLVMQREASINIIVKKGKNRATITVPPNRWKYFFKDREKITTPSGRSKPIFHAVSSHHRHYQSGKISPVKTHYRGLRSFRWGGYAIKIILPGKHGMAQASLGLSGEIVSDEKLASGDWVDMGGRKVATKLNAAFEGD